jgi:hypothetical protein
MIVPSPFADNKRRQPRPIVIASYVCYAWGAILLVPTIIISLSLLSRPRAFIAAMAFPSIVISIGLAYCVSAYLLRRQRRFGAWFTVSLVALTTALQVVMHLNFERVDMKPAWLIVNALLLILLLSNWSRFGEDDRAVDA